jgi:hypothetical protein
MTRFRTFSFSLVLLLAFGFSGLSALCAPCAATAVPMACHGAVEDGACGDGRLQAGCCCLIEDANSEDAPLVLVPETTKGLSPVFQVERARAFGSSKSSSSLSRQARLARYRPPLFRLHCSLLI